MLQGVVPLRVSKDRYAEESRRRSIQKLPFPFGFCQIHVVCFVMATPQIHSEYASLLLLASYVNLAKTPLTMGSGIGPEGNS